MASDTDDTQQIEGNRTFWSPIAIFFLGTSFAALNWWRMGWKRKAIIFLCISIIVSLFQAWLRQKTFLFYTNIIPVGNSILFLQLFVSIGYSLTLSIIMSYDIQKYNLSGAKSNAVNWKIVFPFALSMALITIGTVFSIDYFSQNTKYCRFPRLQDLLYDKTILNQTGLRSVLMNRYDLDCKIAGVEFYDDLTDNRENRIINTDSYRLLGRAINNPDSSLLIYQKVEVHQDIISQSLVDALMTNEQNPTSTLEIKLEVHHANYLKYNCQLNGENRDCFIVLGYKNILSWFRASQDGLPDKEYEKMLSIIVNNVDERIYQYEINQNRTK